MFNYASLTKNGAALITRAVNGEKFVFTRMEYGNGIPAEFNTSQTSEEVKSILFGRTSLVSKMADIGMYSISTKNNCATLTGKIINSSLTEDFLAKELGVFGKIGEEAEVLVAYFIATESPDPINQAALVGQEHKIIVDVATGNAADITIEYSPEIYATKEDFDALVASNAEEHAALEQAIADITSETITNIQQSITDEVTARKNADTVLQQSITDLEASIDEKIGSIDISGALSHIKQYDHVVDSNETLLAWANCTDGGMKSVLVKSGEYTLDGKMINLVNAGTKFVFAEDGNKITVSNYMRGIGATEDYGAVIIGLNVDLNYTGNDDCYAFYRGMICYNCTGPGTGTKEGYGFYQCTCSNCTGTGTGTSTDYNSGYGFYQCTCSNCIGTGSSYTFGFGAGFYQCTCSNCTGTCIGTGIVTRPGAGTGAGSGYGFIDSTCSNCTGTGIGTGTGVGYGFYQCKHCSSCRAGETASTTATWGGTNTYIDSDSCDYVAA